jgi:hypothetical protein
MKLQGSPMKTRAAVFQVQTKFSQVLRWRVVVLPPDQAPGAVSMTFRTWPEALAYAIKVTRQ